VTRPETDRDRDAAGRPKNARPRDGLGRPLGRGADGEPVMPDDLQLTPAEAVQLAQRLIDEGRPFHAHEVLESVWKSSPSVHRDLWKGLAQIAVGLTHARRGNGRGAVALLRRGAAAVGRYVPGAAGDQRGELPDALDLASVHAAATGLADLIDARGVDAVTTDDLRFPLGPPGAADS
jgi:hypothetical protein